jgi:MinD superfamily P-loop ATPase
MGQATPMWMSFASQKEIPVLMRVPFERAIAEGIARGHTLAEVHPDFRRRMREMFDRIVQEVKQSKEAVGAK